MKSRRTWWFLFSLGAAIVIAALVWISALVLRLEAQAQHEASVRLALYRMDFWLSPRIGRERLRPYFEYLPFYAQQRAYTRILNEIEPGEVITPSPLLTFESEIFRLHFQVDAQGELTSPQLPTGNWRDLAESGGVVGAGAYLAPGMIERRQPLLERVRSILPQQARLESCVVGAESLIADLIGDQLPVELAPPPQQSAMGFQVDAPNTGRPAPTEAPSQQAVQQWASGVQQRGPVQSQISKADIGKRAASNYAQQQEDLNNRQQTAQVLIEPQKGAAVIDVESVQVDELVPVWFKSPDSASDSAQPEAASDDRSLVAASLDGSPTAFAPSNPDSIELVLLRRVRIGSETVYQGILCDWPALRAALKDQISDLFPKAQLVPQPHPSPALMESGRLLGSAPVMLEAPCPPIALNTVTTPARTTLGLAWLAVIGAIVAAGLSLASSIRFGEKRSRFASAVTHELRTPLTTFRMYSEMLAEGMVRDDSQRQTYLRTLQQESGRLSTLVENVLSYARLEEGRIARHVQPMTTGELVERVRSVLTRRAEEAGMSVEMRDESDAAKAPPTLNVDTEIVEQILFNLVDNACKYACESSDKRIEITFTRDFMGLNIEVRDHGPGISAEHARVIFKAFDRGAHGPGDTIPGVGLGLALSRGLARDLGGELTLEQRQGPGACFKLTLGA